MTAAVDEFLIQVLEGKQNLPWKIAIYGIPGIGKSTLAAKAPKPFFLNLENGLKRVDCSKSQHLTTYEHFVAGLKFAAESDYETVVVDTITALEELLGPLAVGAYNSSVDKERLKVDHVSKIGWGKGGEFLAAEWRSVMRLLERLQALGKNILLLGHERIEPVKDPMYENHERLTMRVDKRSAEVIKEATDAVLFAHFPRFVQDKEDGKGKIAKSTGERLLRCIETPGCVAKNRYDLPDTIPMDANLFELLK